MSIVTTRFLCPSPSRHKTCSLKVNMQLRLGTSRGSHSVRISEWTQLSEVTHQRTKWALVPGPLGRTSTMTGYPESCGRPSVRVAVVYAGPTVYSTGVYLCTHTSLYSGERIVQMSHRKYSH